MLNIMIINSNRVKKVQVHLHIVFPIDKNLELYFTYWIFTDLS